jgi:hypothetical protein
MRLAEFAVLPIESRSRQGAVMTNPTATPKRGKPIHYNENAAEYAESGKVEVAAQKAIEALDDADEAVELQKAETQGKSHANRPRMSPPPKGDADGNANARNRTARK